MAPANVKKEGTGFDLPLAIGILAGGQNISTKQCNCTPEHIHRYMSKISGPLLDRIEYQAS